MACYIISDSVVYGPIRKRGWLQHPLFFSPFIENNEPICYIIREDTAYGLKWKRGWLQHPLFFSLPASVKLTTQNQIHVIDDCYHVVNQFDLVHEDTTCGQASGVYAST